MALPRISLLVLAYKQAEFVTEAVRSALAQVCEPIEIVLSDDASPDDTFDRMVAAAQEYRGHHQIVFNRNERNLGIGSHYNRLINLASGELLVTQAGDDVSVAHRVADLAAAWDAAGGRPDLLASHLTAMGASDHKVIRVDDLASWRSVDDWIVRRPFVIGAAHAFTKRLHRRFGAFVDGLTYEDQANTLRAIGSGGAITVDKPLVHYRLGGISSGRDDIRPEAFVAWVRRRNQGHLALHQQWLKDAAVIGCLDAVDLATRHEHERERFIARLLDASSDIDRWRTALESSHLSLSWRLRKAAHLTWPSLATFRRRT